MLLIASASWAEQAADSEPSLEKGLDWAEKKLDPSNQWIEQHVAPFSQWFEGQLHEMQDQHRHAPSQPTRSPSERPSPQSSRDDVQPPPISSDRASLIALRRFPGDLLSVRWKLFQGQPSYRVQLLTAKGRVRVVYIHAHSGEIIERKKR